MIPRKSAVEQGGSARKFSLCHNVCPSPVRRVFKIPPQHHSISRAPGPYSPEECVEGVFSEAGGLSRASGVSPTCLAHRRLQAWWFACYPKSLSLRGGRLGLPRRGLRR